MSNGNSLVDFVYSDMERFFFNRLVYVSLRLDISQGVFQKISTRQNKSQKVVCSQENIQSGLSSKEDACCFGKGRAGYYTCKWESTISSYRFGRIPVP